MGIIHSLSEVEDDPNLHVEGIELFRDFPREMALIRKQVAEAHDRYPGLKVITHIAHSIYCTDRPQQFSDSRVISLDGKHASWGDGSAFGPSDRPRVGGGGSFIPGPAIVASTRFTRLTPEALRPRTRLSLQSIGAESERNSTWTNTNPRSSSPFP